MICPRPMCYLTALFRPPLLASRAPTVAWGCLIGVRLVKSVTQWPPAARKEALVGGAAQNGVISPARVVCVATIEFTIPGPVSIITPQNSMGAIIAWKGTAWYLLTEPTYRPIWIELPMHSDIITPTGWVHVREGAPREGAAVDLPPARPSFPQRVTPMIRDFTF